ncbi:MAG: hypothetical protein JXR78_12520 [Victivallales bacterium]|nr:hypothetical protein [Victivallales bacterium]
MCRVKWFVLLLLSVCAALASGQKTEKFVPADKDVVSQAFASGWEMYVFIPPANCNDLQHIGQFKFERIERGALLKGVKVGKDLYLMDLKGNIFQASSGNRYNLTPLVSNPAQYKKKGEQELSQLQKLYDASKKKHESYISKRKAVQAVFNRYKDSKEKADRDKTANARKNIRALDKTINRSAKQLKKRQDEIKDVEKKVNDFNAAFDKLSKEKASLKK